MAGVKEFDPGKVVVTWGPLILSGFAEDSMVRVARDEDGVTKKVGADGEVTRIKNRNKSGSIEVDLMSSAPSNTELSALYALDEGGTSQVWPFTVKDMNGETLHFAAQSWIKKLPDDEIGKDIGERTWVFDTGPMSNALGGSSDA